MAPLRADPPAPFYLSGGWYQGPVTHLAFSPDGKVLASGDGEVVRLRDLAAREDYASFESRGPIAFSPRGNKLATMDGLWYARTGQRCGRLVFWDAQLVFSRDGDYVAHSNAEREGARGVKVISLNPDAKELELKEDEDLPLSPTSKDLARVAFPPDGTTLVVGPLIRNVGGKRRSMTYTSSSMIWGR
jgi:WD40 repeat protein